MNTLTSTDPDPARAPMNPPRDPLVVPLAELRRADAATVGGKAAHLGELSANGFAVPDAAVITTRAFLESIGSLDDVPDRERVLGLSLPADLETALRAAVGKLGGHALAVRSSALGEDGTGASFAGQYDTVLGVKGADAVLDAVRRVWASAFGERATKYREQRDIARAPMGVIVQRMVEPMAAGVAFTANPLTGARDECLVSAVRGIGERLVSGAASPDEWRILGDRVEATAQPERAISEAQVRQVADLARRIERHFAAPQDIEWAIGAGNTLFVLQARPITALPSGPETSEQVEPVPIDIVAPPGSWERESAHNPDPPSPLYQVFFAHSLPHMASAFADAGLLADGIEFRVIGGRAYQRIVPLGGKEEKEPPAWLLPIIMPVLRRVVPSLRRRIKRCVDAVQCDEYYTRCRWWLDEGRGELMAQNQAMLAADLAALSDAELAQELERAVEHNARAIAVHVRFIMGLIVVSGECLFFAKRALGWEEERILGLFSGTSELSTAPGRALARLAELAKQRPAVRALLEQPSSELEDRLAAVDPHFSEQWKAFMREFGCRGLRHDDIIEPTMQERPQLVASLILGQMQQCFDFSAVDAQVKRDRLALLDEARRELSDRPGECEELERLVERATEVYPLREDNAFHTQGVPVAIWRRVALEVGRRLAHRGRLAEPDDVFFLYHDEAVRAIGESADKRALIQRRKGERKWAESADLPENFGPKQPTDPPPMGWMPKEVRLVVSSFLWMVDRVSEARLSARRQDGQGALDGLAASAGIYEGTVRVVTNERQFGKVKPGDVLVCVATSPVWSVLFPSLGALVTDAGGILSHQSIIAREHRIPAVVATGNATKLLRDGQRVRVDGDRGRVEVLA